MALPLGANVWELLKENSAFMTEYDKVNRSLANSLTQLSEQAHDIQGRDNELVLLEDVLERPKTPVALLQGEAGVGKSALMEEFVKQINNNKIETVAGRKYFVVALRLGYLKGLGNDLLQSAITGLLDTLKKLEELAQLVLDDKGIRIILFIDEVHMLVTIFGIGTKIGGDLMKDVLARAPIRVVAATTRREYDSTIAVDEPLAQRFKVIEMHELPTNVVLKICQNWWKTTARDSYNRPMPIPTDSVFMKILEANKAYRSNQAEPRKSLDILEDLVSYQLRTNNVATESVVENIFLKRFSISLNISFDADSVFEHIKTQVIGQVYALDALHSALRRIAYQLRPKSNKPIATFLFAGPTGVGKTQTTKALSESIFKDKATPMLNINMPDYKDDKLEPKFRKTLGEYVRHNPYTVILLDELEKASQAIMDALLAILDEGVVKFDIENREKNIETHSQSLRNTIIIATTNEGHQVFKNQAQMTDSGTSDMNHQQKAQYARLHTQLKDHLITIGYRPEMLNRFDAIVPFTNLGGDVLIDIADGVINSTLELFRQKGLTIHTKDPQDYIYAIDDSGERVKRACDLSAYVALVLSSSDDPNKGGARNISQNVQRSIEDTIINATYEYPNDIEFDVYVSKNTRLYDSGNDATEGGVIVEPTMDAIMRNGNRFENVLNPSIEDYYQVQY